MSASISGDKVGLNSLEIMRSSALSVSLSMSLVLAVVYITLVLGEDIDTATAVAEQLQVVLLGVGRAACLHIAFATGSYRTLWRAPSPPATKPRIHSVLNT